MRQGPACTEYVFAVVQDKQQLSRAESLHEGVEDGAIGRLCYPERGGDGRCHQLRIGDGGELGQPDAVLPFIEHVRCCLDGQPRFPDPARSGKRHDADPR